MESYLDPQGKLIQKPETLVERLELDAPELAMKYQHIKDSLAVFNMYKTFLYSFPREEELNSAAGRGINWEEYLGFIESQFELGKWVGALDNLRSGNKDLTADKVLVVRSDRPFYDTLLAKKDTIGNSEGWVGIVESFDITNIDGSNFFSHDGKIYQRFVLKDARKITAQELKDWAVTGALYYENPHYGEGVDSLIDRLEKSPLGTERISIYDKYPSVDYCILTHIPKEDEKAVAHISYEQAERIDITHLYGERQIDGSEFILMQNYPKDPWRYGIAFIGEDERQICEIYASIFPQLKEHMRTEFKNSRKLEKIDMQFGRLIVDHITEEQHAKAKKAPDEDTNKWYKKFIDEQGLEISKTTFISINAWENRYAKEESRKRLLDALEYLLKPRGYVRTQIDFSCGHGNGSAGRIILEPTFDLEWRAKLFAGEFMEYTRNNIQGSI